MNIACVAAAAIAAVTAPVATAGPVSMINGYYDVDAPDTPSLHVSNSTSFDFTNVLLTLTGYQGLNKDVTQSVRLADITAGSTAILIWGSIAGADGSLTPGNLFAGDYDDEYGGSFRPVTGFGLASLSGHLVRAPQCTAQAEIYGWDYCADTGNFYVTLTASWNGESIEAQFSPDNSVPGAGNAAGQFVGWEGLNRYGWAETATDSHSNSGTSGVLAYMYQGVPVEAAPEPGTMLLCLSALGVVGFGFRRRFRA